MFNSVCKSIPHRRHCAHVLNYYCLSRGRFFFLCHPVHKQIYYAEVVLMWRWISLRSKCKAKSHIPFGKWHTTDETLYSPHRRYHSSPSDQYNPFHNKRNKINENRNNRWWVFRRIRFEFYVFVSNFYFFYFSLLRFHLLFLFRYNFSIQLHSVRFYSTKERRNTQNGAKCTCSRDRKRGKSNEWETSLLMHPTNIQL